MSAWAAVLDAIAVQIDRQEATLVHGHAPPADLVVDPPQAAMDDLERLRAIDLFERSERLLTQATLRPLPPHLTRPSAYGSRSGQARSRAGQGEL